MALTCDRYIYYSVRNNQLLVDYSHLFGCIGAVVQSSVLTQSRDILGGARGARASRGKYHALAQIVEWLMAFGRRLCLGESGRFLNNFIISIKPISSVRMVVGKKLGVILIFEIGILSTSYQAQQKKIYRRIKCTRDTFIYQPLLTQGKPSGDHRIPNEISLPRGLLRLRVRKNLPRSTFYDQVHARASNGPYYGPYKVNRNGHVSSTNVPSLKFVWRFWRSRTALAKSGLAGAFRRSRRLQKLRALYTASPALSRDIAAVPRRS
ncbi:uncharacterized protein BDR25DRAFT_357110 [Lindgomyces ingoldianus]|uniref:Uncharacterized protein n=1 Tax=Lindgomyces ingoldianus TaxID=673940 RepID=A0ACB6QRM2_9PLEO|nr:uncharacterized protein BDR25DRAFT_357110 [Lindgomyces ingoldianus]KAF2468740.1 hypothetical protein BDR25DRAFT_357110 [Lindgomyces ingoldianus]